MKKITGIFCALCGFCFALFAANSIAVVDEQRIDYKDIPAEVTYTGTTTVGHEFELKLGEDRATGKLWQVVSYDPDVCRLKIDHDRGVGPFTTDKAEIEIKPLVRGTATAVFQCGEKKVTVVVTAL